MLPIEGQINAAANFQAEFESENATDLDCLANSLNSLNAKSAEIKDKKNDVPFSSRRSSHVLQFLSSENVEINIPDETPYATRSKSGIAGLFKGRGGMNINLYQSKVKRSSAIDYSTIEIIGSRLLNICEGEDIYCDQKIDSLSQEIDSLYNKGCLYDALLLQDKKNQDTPLHLAIKKNRADFVEKLLSVLEKPYCSNEFYKHKYFKHKQENEKPLYKVINTKNKDEKDVITLAIEGNNSKCISLLSNCLNRENINRRKDVESEYTPLHEAVLLGKNEAIKKFLKSGDMDTELIDRESYKACNHANDKEAIELFIQHYSNKISKLRTKLEGNNKKLALIKCVLNKTQLTCVCLAAFGSCFRMYKDTHDIINKEVSEDMLHYSLRLLSNTSGLILLFNYLIDTMLSNYKEKNSSLKEESNSYLEERKMLKSELRHFQKRGTEVATQMYEVISVATQTEPSCRRL